MSMFRTRWAAVGAAVAITLGAGGLASVGAISTGQRAVFVPITPCRVFDTRPAFQVGPRSSPLGPSDTYTVAGTGATGSCTIPVDAVGLALNVTAVDASLPTYLTIWAADVAQPTASSLNPSPGEPPTPNAVTTDLSAAGQFNVYNLQGSVHVLADAVGYYVDHDHDDRYYTEAEIDAWLNTPARGVASVTAPAFTPRFPASTVYEIGSGVQLFATGGTEDTFLAPVDLPDGATLGAMRAFVWDDSTTQLDVRLYRTPHRNPVFDVIYSVATATDAPGTLELLDDSPTSTAHSIVDNDVYGYFVLVSCPGSWATAFTDLRLQGVTIEYEW